MTDKQNFEKDINVPSKEQIIIDGVDVSECERHCSDNYNTPNMCYSDITRGYRHCNPKENQCDFYITSIEAQLARKTQECEELKKQLIQKDKVGTNDIEKSLLYIWSECVLEIVSAKQYKEIKKLFDEKIKQTITRSN